MSSIPNCPLLTLREAHSLVQKWVLGLGQLPGILQTPRCRYRQQGCLAVSPVLRETCPQNMTAAGQKHQPRTQGESQLHAMETVRCVVTGASLAYELCRDNLLEKQSSGQPTELCCLLFLPANILEIPVNGSLLLLKACCRARAPSSAVFSADSS